MFSSCINAKKCSQRWSSGCSKLARVACRLNRESQAKALEVPPWT